MNEIQYLVDENTSRALGDQLRRRQPTISIIYVGDELAPPLGTADPDILRWLERESHYLITRNRRSMPRHLREHLATGGHIPGIFTLRPGAPLKQIIEDLLLTWEAADPDEYQNQIVHIPL